MSLRVYAIDALTWNLVGYRFGYELLMMNGALTFFALLAVSTRETPLAEYQTAS